MATNINFYGGNQVAPIAIVSGSGIGFYGSGGFGASVPVGEYNGRCFITDSNGVVSGAEINNVKYVSSGSAILGQAGSGIKLTQIPNYLATMKIQLTSDTAVKTRNAQVRIYDRSNINSAPSGVTCYGAEIIHTDTVQNNNGSGDASWIQLYGSGSTLSMVDSPGLSGLSPSGINTTSTTHDWYLALTATPQSIGSKTQFGLYFAVEYLN